MHDYLRAIGLSGDKAKKVVEKVIKNIKETSIKRKSDGKCKSNDETYETSAEMFTGTGIKVIGEMGKRKKMCVDHYFPYVTGNRISGCEELTFSKRADTNAYTVMCDDPRIGVSLIFYLQNVLEYITKTTEQGKKDYDIYLSGLSIGAKILLPVIDKTDENSHKETNAKRNNLFKAAKNGEENAIENLTLEEMDLTTRVIERAGREDIMSIARTSFIPFGSESDSYTLLAEIDDVRLICNPSSLEEVYVMELNCNDIPITVSINKKDLIGEPAAKRRFYGTVWLQGKVDFSKK
jgi:hypothetical protein